MNDVLKIEGLTKHYPGFTLDGVSFSVPQGSITGFIGRNGAGKTTTLKSALGLVHPDAVSVFYFGLPFSGSEGEIKQRVGFASGAVNYYKKKKLCDIAEVTSRFYNSWDKDAFTRCMDRFSLDPEKTPEKLSEGMRVKFNLALALSHKAELLILDEPTSGLDPVSREELLELFLALRDEGISILFSTHIISDLDRCADRIVYLQHGRVLTESGLGEFADSFRIVMPEDISTNAEFILGSCRTKDGVTCLVKSENASLFGGEAAKPTLEEIMLHLEKESI